jgi:hypothetical protein
MSTSDATAEAGQRHARAMEVSPELLEERWIASDAFV